jgi:hypothetical protein
LSIFACVQLQLHTLTCLLLMLMLLVEAVGHGSCFGNS